MNGGIDVEIAELVLTGTGAAVGEQVGRAFQRELGRLWREDCASGIGWRREIPTLILELDPLLGAEPLGEAIAREVRLRAIVSGASCEA